MTGPHRPWCAPGACDDVYHRGEERTIELPSGDRIRLMLTQEGEQPPVLCAALSGSMGSIVVKMPLASAEVLGVELTTMVSGAGGG